MNNTHPDSGLTLSKIITIMTEFEKSYGKTATVELAAELTYIFESYIESKRKYAQQMYDNGATKKEIAETVRVSRQTVYSWFKYQDKEANTKVTERVLHLYEDGMSIRAISKELGISRTKVSNIVNNQAYRSKS